MGLYVNLLKRFPEESYNVDYHIAKLETEQLPQLKKYFILAEPQSTIPLFYSKYVGYIVGLA